MTQIQRPTGVKPLRLRGQTTIVSKDKERRRRRKLYNYIGLAVVPVVGLVGLGAILANYSPKTEPLFPPVPKSGYHAGTESHVESPTGKLKDNLTVCIDLAVGPITTGKSSLGQGDSSLGPGTQLSAREIMEAVISQLIALEYDVGKITRSPRQIIGNVVSQTIEVSASGSGTANGTVNLSVVVTTRNMVPTDIAVTAYKSNGHQSL